MSIFAGKLLEMAGLHVPAVALFAACALAAWFCAWKNVRLSAMLMLVLEGASTAPILLLCLTTLAQHGFAVDCLQLDTAALPLASPWCWHRSCDLQPGLFRSRNRLR